MKRDNRQARININEAIRAPEVRLIDASGENVGVIPTSEALARAKEAGVDLVEISSSVTPPVAKIVSYGKFLYDLKKKKKESRTKSASTETKNVQIKVGTGEHDLQLKAKNTSKWLSEGHRVKVELYLRGRAKYMDKDFLKERVDRFLQLLSTPYKVAQELKKGPKGLFMVLERGQQNSKEKHEDE